MEWAVALRTKNEIGLRRSDGALCNKILQNHCMHEQKSNEARAPGSAH